jgi:hypothetical protein
MQVLCVLLLLRFWWNMKIQYVDCRFDFEARFPRENLREPPRWKEALKTVFKMRLRME